MRSFLPRCIILAVPLGVLLLLNACLQPERHPMLTPSMEADLRRAEGLDPVSSSRSVPETLASQPTELPIDLLQKARRAVGQDAPSSWELQLQEIHQEVLANNLDIRVDLLSPSIADATVNVEDARFQAVLTATLAGTETRGGSGLSDRVPTRTGTLAPGVSVPLRTGGTFSVSLPFEGTEVERLADIRTPGLDLSITQPLLRAAGLQFNDAPIRIARLERRVADARTKLTAVSVLAAADRAYWSYYASYRRLEVALQQYKWAEEQVALAQRLVDEGVLTRVEITRARAGLPQRLEGIIVAETERRRLQRELKRLINRPNVPIDSPTTILPRSDPNPLRLDLDRSSLTQLAVQNRMDLVINDIQAAINDTQVAIERNLTLPSINFQATYSFRGSKSHLGDALGQLFDRELDQWTVAIAAEIPLGNKAAQSRLDRALLERLRTRATRDRIVQAIQQDVLDVVDAFEQNWQRILAARQETVLAAETYEAEKRQFQGGVVTSTEVLEAAQRVSDAQSREINALRDYQTSLVDLAEATGTVLGLGRVEWSPTPLR